MLAVGELQPGVVYCRLIHSHSALVLRHQGLLRGDLLLGDRILLEERVVALQIELGVAQQRAIALELTLSLGELHFERAWIDFGQAVASAHHLALLEIHLDELTVDAALDRDCVERRHRTQAG